MIRGPVEPTMIRGWPENKENRQPNTPAPNIISVTPIQLSTFSPVNKFTSINDQTAGLVYNIQNTTLIHTSNG